MAWPTTSRQSRGYGAGWDRLRKGILQRDNYLCQCEQCQGGKLRLTAASEVDHIVSKAEWRRRYGTLNGVDDPSNLQAINHRCHKRKSQLEQGHTPARRIGLDGLPIES